MFMRILLLPLTAVFGETADIASFNACPSTALYLDHQYTKYHDDHKVITSKFIGLGVEDNNMIIFSFWPNKFRVSCTVTRCH